MLVEAVYLSQDSIETNPSIAQFWLSYIDALIKLDRKADAKAVLDQAMSKGVKGDDFDQVQSKLVYIAEIEGHQTVEEILAKAVDLRKVVSIMTQLILKNSISNFPETQCSSDTITLLYFK